MSAGSTPIAPRTNGSFTAHHELATDRGGLVRHRHRERREDKRRGMLCESDFGTRVSVRLSSPPFLLTASFRSYSFSYSRVDVGDTQEFRRQCAERSEPYVTWLRRREIDVSLTLVNHMSSCLSFILADDD